MKNQKIFLIFITIFNTISAQVPSIQWQKTFGGIKDDRAYSVCITNDGGSLVAGKSQYDFGAWLIKLDSLGNELWNKHYGWTGFDEARSIVQTFDDGYIFAGSTDSNGGAITGYHGGGDIWVVKTDSIGNLTWQKCLGGSKSDFANDIIQTADSGYLITGEVESFDYDVTGYHGFYDMWVVKLNQNGFKEWSKSLGGSYYEAGNSSKQTKDGGYLIAGYSSSVNGDVTGLHGDNFDAWVVKLNSLGQLEWQKCYGGSNSEIAFGIVLSYDGGVFVLSPTSSSDGDVVGSFGFTDFWLFKADSLGNILWQKCFGGTSKEAPYSLSLTSDGGIIMVGIAALDEGMVSGTYEGYLDWWVVKADSAGAFEWGKVLGGYGVDVASSIKETPDGGYIAVGYTTSYDGNITLNHGGEDYWVVKLAPLGLAVPELENSFMELNIFQNNNQLNLRYFSKQNQQAQLFLYDINGKNVFEKSISVNAGINYNTFSIADLAAGMYFVRMDGEKGWQSGKVVIE